MISANEIRRIAAKSGARNVKNVETDILLTFLLQLFHERGVLQHLAFKGGTMLRKMVFGPRGRLSTDLDFTATSELSPDDLTLKRSSPKNCELPANAQKFAICMTLPKAWTAPLIGRSCAGWPC